MRVKGDDCVFWVLESLEDFQEFLEGYDYPQSDESFLPKKYPCLAIPTEGELGWYPTFIYFSELLPVLKSLGITP